MNIKKYSKEHFEEINSWWEHNGMEGFTEDFIPETSYVIENDNKNIAFISVVLTNIKEYCHLENLVGNPNIEKNIRKECVQALIRHAEQEVKTLGYKKLMCMSNTQKLKDYYKQLGYSLTISDVSCFIKEM